MKSSVQFEDEDLFFHSTIDSYLSNPRLINRHWLINDIESILKEPECRFVLLTADPGMGKSTFLAQIANKYRSQSLVYFIREDQCASLSDVGAHSFLLRTGFQLAAIHPELFEEEKIKITIEQHINSLISTGEAVGLEVDRIIKSPFYDCAIQIVQDIKKAKGSVVGIRAKELNVDPRTIPIGNLEFMALINPAQILLQENPQAQLLIFIDALDEIQYQKAKVDISIVQWLINVPKLPKNIKFVLTSRSPDRDVGLFCQNQSRYVKKLHINPLDSRISKELMLYSNKLVSNEIVKDIIEHTAEAKDFTSRAVHKAKGNIGYMDAIARAIDQVIKNLNSAKNIKEKEIYIKALKEFLSLKELPEHLYGLYGFFLGQIRSMVGEDKAVVEDLPPMDYPLAWIAVYSRIIGVLATVFEPINVEHIQKLGNIKTDLGEVYEAINRLTQFLDIKDDKYQFYHATIKEFITSEDTKRTSSIAYLYIDPIKWHTRIVDYYWNQFHSRWNECDDDYGLNNIALHLYTMGQTDRLIKLIDKVWTEVRYSRGGNSFSGVLRDIEIAWKSLSDKNTTDITPFIRLKVISTVISANYRSGDIKTLVWLDRSSEAIELINLSGSAKTKVRELISMYHELKLKGEENSELLDNALNVAVNITPETDRYYMLDYLIREFTEINSSHLEEAVTEAESAIRHVSDLNTRFNLMVNFAVLVNNINNDKSLALFTEAQTLIEDFNDPEERSKAFLELAISQADINLDLAEEFLNKAYDKAQLIPDDSVQSYFNTSPGGKSSTLREIAVIMAWLRDSRAEAVFKEAISEFETLISPDETDEWYSEMCKSLSGSGYLDVTEILVHKIKNEQVFFFTRCEICDSLTERNQELALNMMHTIKKDVESLDTRYIKEEVYYKLLVLFLKLNYFDEAQKLSKEIQNEPWLSYGLHDLTIALAKAENFTEAEKIIPQISNTLSRGQAEVVLAEYYIQSGKPEKAREIADSTQNAGTNHSVLNRLAYYYARTKDEKAVAIYNEALSARDESLLQLGTNKGALHGIVNMLIKDNEFDTACLVLNKIKDAQTQSECLIKLGSELMDTNEKKALEFLLEAQEAISNIEDDYYREKLLVELAKVYATNRYFNESDSLIGRFRMLDSQLEVATETLLSLSKSNDPRTNMMFQQYNQYAEENDHKYWGVETLVELAISMRREPGFPYYFEIAENTARNITDHSISVRNLCKLASGLIDTNPQQSKKLFEDLEFKVKKIEDKFWKEALLRDIAKGFAELGCINKALELVSKFDDWGGRLTPLSICAKKLLNENKFEEAEKLIESESNSYAYRDLMLDFGVELSRRNIEDADRILKKIEDYIFSLGGFNDMDIEYLVDALVKSGRFIYALKIFTPLDLDYLIYKITSWISELDEGSPEQNGNILQTITSIAAWYRPSWQGVYQILNDNRSFNKM